MKFCRVILLTITVLLVLVGCRQENDYRSLIATPILKVTDNLLNALITKETDKATKLLIPDLRKGTGVLLIKDAAEALSISPVILPAPYEIVSFEARGEIYGSHYELTYQLQREQGWVLVHIGVDDVYKRFYGITNIEYRFIPRPLQELNAFTFEGKPWLHYVVLACCAVMVIVALWSFILLLRTKTRKRWIWWFWCFVIFLGFVRISFNWTSGQLSLDPVGGVGTQILHHLGWVVNVIHVSRYEPWYIQFMLPVGAILFLWRRKALEQRAEETHNNTVE